MNKKKFLIPILIILLLLSLSYNAFLIYKSVDDSLRIYSLEFLLSKEKNEKSKLKYDRYDAIQVLKSQSCFSKTNFDYRVYDSRMDMDLWQIEVLGEIDNPDTEVDEDYISTLGIYTLNKKTGELKDKSNNSNDICSNPKQSIEKARDKLMSFKCLVDYINENQKRHISVTTDSNDNNLWLFRLYEDMSGHNATYGWYTVDKNTGVVKDALFEDKEVCRERI